MGIEKMFLAELLSVGVLFYFHFDFAHGTFSKLDSWYLDVFGNRKHDDMHLVCDQTIFEWAYYCQHVFALLRRDESEYWNWLYADYFAFIKEGFPKCDKIKLILSTGEIVLQYVLPCYGSSLIVSSDRESSSVTYVSDIAIYPADNDTSVLILKEIQKVDDTAVNPDDDTSTLGLEETENKTKYFYLWKMYPEFKIWNSIHIVPPFLFSHPRPQSTNLSTVLDDNDDILNVWNNVYNGRNRENNILNEVNINEFWKLCSWVYGQKKYTHKFRFRDMSEDDVCVEQQGNIKLVFLHNIKEVERIEQLKETGSLVLRKNKNHAIKHFVVEIYGCYENKKAPMKTEYSISAGAQNDSLILYKVLKYSHESRVYPLENITFMDLQYLKNVP